MRFYVCTHMPPLRSFEHLGDNDRRGQEANLWTGFTSWFEPFPIPYPSPIETNRVGASVPQSFRDESDERAFHIRHEKELDQV